MEKFAEKAAGGKWKLANERAETLIEKGLRREQYRWQGKHIESVGGGSWEKEGLEGSREMRYGGEQRRAGGGRGGEE